MLPENVVGRRYQLQGLIGQGGMGAVYRAYDRLTGQIVALKRVTTSELDLSLSPSWDVTDFHVSLAQEFKLLASLRHPNIIAVLDYGFDQDHEPYYTMELLEDAQTLLEVGCPLPLKQKIDLLVQVLQALAYLHRRGILHRDLKPANVLVMNGTVKVLDFGLSVMRDHVVQADEQDTTTGTLGYMAPEVLLGHHATEASDLYGVGVIAYELFANRHLFDFDDINKLIHDILYTPVNVDHLDISSPIAQILLRLLAKTPEERYASALQVIGAFSQALDHSIHVETEAIRDSFLQAARFIGREQELDELSGALQDSIQGHGKLWLIAGESGVGKSRLVDELRTRALVKGALVIQGHTVNTGGTPYQMWRPVLGWLPLLRDLDEDEAAVMRAIAPDATTLPGSDGSIQVEPNTVQTRLLKLVRDTFATQRVLIIFEDLHWAGSESLALLAQFQMQLKDMPLLVIASYRDDEQPDLPAHFPDASVMRLARLSEDQIAELSQAMLGEAGNQPQVIDLLKRETEGNVFFIIEVIRTLAEEAGQLEEIGLMTLPQQVFAGGMWRIIQRRLQHVPDYARPLLQLAAVSGRDQELPLLHALAPEVDLDHWLLDCTNIAVLEIVEGAWRFTHDKLREGVLDGLTLAQRRELHAKVAEAMEKLYGGASERIPALAYHWGMAENDEKEGIYVRLAGEQSLRSSAYREAIVYLERALELILESDHTRRINVMHKLAEANLGVGGYERAGWLYKESVRIARQNGDSEAQASALARLGDIAYAQNHLEEARTYYTQSQAIYRKLNDAAGIARTLNGLGSVAYDTGDNQTAKRLYHESMALTRGIEGHWSMAGALRGGSASSPNIQEVQELLQTLDHHIRRGDKPEAAAALFQLGETAKEQGKAAEAREYFRRSAATSREINDQIGVARAYNALGLLALSLDNRDEARQYFHSALKAAHSADSVKLALPVLFGITQYFLGSSIERAIELLAFVLYHPDIPDSLQDHAENLAFNLQMQVAPAVLEKVWERGKNREFEALTLDTLREL